MKRRERFSDLIRNSISIFAIGLIVTACGGSPNEVPSTVNVTTDPFSNRVSQGNNIKNAELEASRSEVRANSDATTNTNSDPYRNDYYTDPYQNLNNTTEDTNSEKSNLNLGQYGMFAGLLAGLSFLSSDMSPLKLFGDDKTKEKKEDKEDKTKPTTRNLEDHSNHVGSDTSALDNTLGRVEENPSSTSTEADSDNQNSDVPVFNFEIPVTKDSGTTSDESTETPEDSGTPLTLNDECHIDFNSYPGILNSRDANQIFNERKI